MIRPELTHNIDFALRVAYKLNNTVLVDAESSPERYRGRTEIQKAAGWGTIPDTTPGGGTISDTTRGGETIPDTTPGGGTIPDCT